MVANAAAKQSTVQSIVQNAVRLRRAVVVTLTGTRRPNEPKKRDAVRAMGMRSNRVADPIAMRRDVGTAIIARRIAAQSPAVRAAVRATVVQRRLRRGWLGDPRLVRGRLLDLRLGGEARVAVPALAASGALDLLGLPLGQAVGGLALDLHVVPLLPRAVAMIANAARRDRQRLANALVDSARRQAWPAAVSVVPPAMPIVALTLIVGMTTAGMLRAAMTTATSAAWDRLQVAALAWASWVHLQAVVLRPVHHRVGMAGNANSATPPRVVRAIKIVAVVARLSREVANVDFPRNAR